jgi:lysophospholipase L1-like esterase
MNKFSRQLTKQHLFRILCLCSSIVGGLLLSEASLQFLLPKQYYIWPPHSEMLYKPDQNIMPGISGPSRFAVNSIGLRGDELTGSDRHRILAIGGSSTECLYLDQYETWPYLLQKTLTEKASQRVWVGNAGMSGRTTRHHLMALQYLPLREMRIDTVILLIGVNDFLTRINQADGYDPDFLAKTEARNILFNDTFTAGGPRIYSDDPFFKQTALWQMLRKAKRWASPNTAQGNIQDPVGKIYVTWRKHRQQAGEIQNELPDLSLALREYARNIYAMIDMVQEKGVRLILMTQPSMWKSGLPENLEGLLWLGGIGDFQNKSGKVYYSAEALQKGIDKYNNTLLEICRERQVECIDLSSILEKDTTVFYDDDHFNESGAQKVSTALSSYILSRESFRGSDLVRD